jgi:hypothetical protein
VALLTSCIPQLRLQRRPESRLTAYSRALTRLLVAMLGCVNAHAFAGTAVPDALAEQWRQYLADEPKSIIELQPFRRTASVNHVGTSPGRVSLTNLNPATNEWFLLEIAQPNGNQLRYHLDNPLATRQRVSLDPDGRGVVLEVNSSSETCELWDGSMARDIEEASRSALPDAPLCGARLFLRNQVAGTFSNLERITDFLRDHVWGGDRLVNMVRDEVFVDAFIERGAPRASAGHDEAASAGNGLAGEDERTGQDRPAAAAIDPAYRGMSVRPEQLGIELPVSQMQLGRWYGASAGQGIFVSAMQPAAIPKSILSTYKDSVNALDPTESGALDYLVAFDLDRFELGFELGTDHPRVEWSERVPPEMHDPRLGGPDGIGNVTPLVVNGIVSPALLNRIVATFAGGFKREHGAFRYGALAQRNAGSHYGFIEQGTIFSKLQPGLATLLVRTDGRIEMKTWDAADEPGLSGIRHARQNGVALIERTDAGVSHPGPLVNQWGAGNWSGSSEEHLRTLRAGACLEERGHEKFLIYGYFSTATPSAMARVFQAYGCDYAMHLDMNALEHTYFALYVARGGRVEVQHLVQGMAAVDRKGGSKLAPRFLSFPDDRDFFYVLRKES